MVATFAVNPTLHNRADVFRHGGCHEMIIVAFVFTEMVGAHLSARKTREVVGNYYPGQLKIQMLDERGVSVREGIL